MIQTIAPIVVAIIGAAIGSFLNACIYRMPRDISISHPRRSFCPSCERMIPWYENLPIISWLALRGRCSGCGTRISPRYLLVELLTAFAFYAVWQQAQGVLAPPSSYFLGATYCVFLALLITATFIDIEHFIIPDEITIGGAVAGLVFSLALPELMGVSSRLAALGLSLAGAAVGFGSLWLIVEFGKLAFGKKKHVFPETEPFVWQRHGETATLKIGAEELAWDEIFSRESDVLILQCSTFEIAGEKREAATLRFHYNRVENAGQETNLDDLDVISGSLQSVVIPREAMGFGDVKFMATIGAFLGWKAALFAIGAGAVIGCVASIAGILIAKDRAGVRLPFGPYLALGAALWIFYGEKIFSWYFGAFPWPIQLGLS